MSPEVLTSTTYEICRASVDGWTNDTLQQIVELEARLFHETFAIETPDFSVTHEEIDSWDLTPEVRKQTHYNRYLRHVASGNAEVWTIMDGNRVVAFGVATNLPEGSLTDEPHLNGRPYIRKLYVDSDYQDVGIGHSLLAVMEQWLLDEHALDVAKYGIVVEAVSYTRAPLFYERRGYEFDNELNQRYQLEVVADFTVHDVLLHKVWPGQ